MEAYIGEIRLFSFDFVPKNWSACDGQTLSISQNQALFSILGTTYGGNGSTTFMLPDLRGRTPVHSGNSGPGAPALGKTGGQETIKLTAAQMPGHGHQFLCAESQATFTTPTDNILGIAGQNAMYSQSIQATPLASGAAGGAGLPYDSRQPFQTLQYCICIYGLYPSRP